MAITGANGFLGRHLADHFRRRGWRVRGLVRDLTRRPFREPGISLHLCDLPDRIDENALRDVDVLVHAAYMSRFTTLAEAKRVNEEGTDRLYALAKAAGVGRFVFVSSTSAHDGALSYYGKSKRAIEKRLDPARDLVLRPGLVLGEGGGLFGRLVSALRRTGVVPIFDGGRQTVQTVHVEDVCLALEQALGRGLAGLYVVAEPAGIEMRELFRLMAAKMGRRVVLVPVPTGPLLLVIRAFEALRVRLPVSSENLLGVRGMRHQPSAQDLETLGVRARTAAESLELLLSPDGGRAGGGG